MIRTYHAPCPLGVEEPLAEELRQLGVRQLRVRKGAVDFRGDRRLAYRACLWVRCCIRIQEQLAEGPVREGKDLYDLARSVPWDRFTGPDRTLSVHASGRHPAFRDTRYPALVIKDAVCDSLRDRTGRRPFVDRQNADLPLRVHLGDRSARLYRDLAGRSLHKRGWRPVQVKSPLNEALAAGLLRLAEWDGSTSLLDPMCGSGTFVVEAAMMAADRAPGLGRRFAFERWLDHDAGLLRDLRDEAAARARSELPFALVGADRHAGALGFAVKGARAAGVEDLVRFQCADAERLTPEEPPGLVMVNPPYGKRLGEGEDLEHSWRSLGRLLRERCPGATAYVLCGEPELTRHLGMRASRKHPVNNGPISCRLLRYEVRA